MSDVYHKLIKISEIPDEGHVAVSIKRHDLLVAAVKGEYYVVRNMCTHAQSELAGGIQKGCFIFCPLHAARYDLRDGSTKGKLTNKALDVFECRVNNGFVETNLMPIDKA